jgi:hypothetical protein
MSRHSMPIMMREGKKVSPEYRGKCDRYSNEGSARRVERATGSLTLGEFSRKKRRNSDPLRRATHSAQRDVAALVVPVLFTAAMSSG